MDARRILIIGARGIGGSEGGVEKFAEEFIRRVARSCRVTLLALSDRRPDDIGDVELIRAPGSRFMRTDKLFYYMIAAWICLTRRFDCVMLLGINSAMLVFPVRLAFWHRAKVVVRSGSVDYALDKWGFLPKIYLKQAERALRFADLVVAVAPSIQRHLRTRGIGAVVIPNGVSAAGGAQRVDRDPRHVVAVGRVTMQKNYRLLIEAAQLLRDRGVRISIVGGADLSDEGARLQAFVRGNGVDNVTFTGVMDRARVLDCLAKASLFVNCSIHEGMSNAVLEAIQQGTPVLLSDIEANRDLGLPDAFYFDPTSPAELASRIEAALEAPSDFQVDRGRFQDWDDVIESYRRHMNLPPSLAQPVPSAACGDSGPGAA